MSKFWTLPNIISVLRMVAVPFVVLFLYLEKYLHIEKGITDNSVYCWIAGIFYIFAALSDILDGYLARKMNQVSTFGKFLDPLADKILVITALVMLVGLDRVPAWLAIIVVGRELAITSLRSMAVSDGVVIAASKLGKIKTVLQNTALGFLIVHYAIHPFGLTLPTHSIGMTLLVLAVAWTVWSGIDYGYDFFIAREKKEQVTPPTE